MPPIESSGVASADIGRPRSRSRGRQRGQVVTVFFRVSWCGVRAVPRALPVDRRGVLREIHARDGLDGPVRKLLAK